MRIDLCLQKEAISIVRILATPFLSTSHNGVPQEAQRNVSIAAHPLHRVRYLYNSKRWETAQIQPAYVLVGLISSMYIQYIPFQKRYFRCL